MMLILIMNDGVDVDNDYGGVDDDVVDDDD